MLPEFNPAGRFRKRIVAPRMLSKALAEEIGIHIGDGSLTVRPKEGHFEYYVTLNREEESYKNRIICLLRKVYGINPSSVDVEHNTLTIEYSSKMLVMFKNAMGLRTGKKTGILIPRFVANSKFSLDCIRGIFDTDGSVTFKKKTYVNHCYPVVKIDNMNSCLIEQISRILNELGFKTSCQFDSPHVASNGSKSFVSTVYMYGNDNLIRWFGLISPKNEIHLTKYWIWIKFGFCPPRTTLEQRKLILEGKSSPEKCYNAGAEI